ncbi:histidine kinase [Tenacibaculum sp. HL-MS23]|uniref:sensor histidine kinase n=1 Tax=unclassified Tenacibaculum TaxID=2635139 RepID=UPI001C4EFA25|nr:MULTISPECIES: ATP-binding protein [unclassified Tenacibaculum]QXP72826.1 histidine kinase [Tenacibaculum sp. AHE14PA]QXP76740.1 histidine kinase [Tenacibaculum sp. AHE15PA]WNW00871.1 histidine kinase [Tenacibaculum sp. HL-MS23]
MEQEEGRILVITTLVLMAIIIFVIVLFTVFQRRKNKLLLEREEDRKRYEKEIAETQIEIREETLRNISWELHDNIGQLLTLAKIQMQHASPENISEISDTITKSLAEIRALSKSINPDFIKNIKLMEALKLEIERFNRLNYIESSLTITGKETRINQKHEIIIFRMLQEFFSNTIKHSKASKLDVSISYGKDVIKIISKDNGIGFEANKNGLKGIGLQNIKARAKLIKAEVKMESELKKGTSLIINYYI